jgi:hypothetical protein
MFSDHLDLQGKRGVKELEQWGAYAVIVNKRLYEAGHAGKYTLVNVKERWVDSVHPNQAQAAREARQRNPL